MDAKAQEEMHIRKRGKRMKKIRRWLSIVLAMVMVLSMNVAAFAEESEGATSGTASVTIHGSESTIAFTTSADMTLRQALINAKANNTITALDWKQVSDWQDASLTHYALIQINDDIAETGTSADLENTDFSSLTEENAVEGHPGYYLVSQSGNTYHYVYVGYDWTYTVNDAEVYDYMCCHTLNAGDVVDITYSLTVSDWTQTGSL